MEEEKEVTKAEELIAMWNEVVEALILVRDKWEELQKFVMEEGGRSLIESCPIRLVKYASMYYRTAFLNFVPDVLRHCRSYVGNLEDMIIKEDEDAR